MPTKITVTNPQPITVKVSTGKDQIVHSSTTFVGSANNFLPDTGGSLSGNLTVQGSTTTNTLTVLGNTYTGHILPRADRVYNIGSPTLRFKTLYLAGNTIDLGGGTISADGNTVYLTSPEGGTLFFTGDANTTVDAAAGERAETTANAAYDLSTASFYYAGTAVYTAEDANTVATAAYATTNAAYEQANASYELGVAAYYYSGNAVYTAESANSTAQQASNTAESAAQTANNSYDLATASFYYSGVAVYTSEDASNTAQTAAAAAQTAYESAQTAVQLANSASETANITSQIVNEFLANSNTIVRVTGGDLTGTLRFINEPTAGLTLGPVESSYGLDVYSTDGGYSQLNYSNIHVAYADTTGIHMQTPNSTIGINSSDESVEIITDSIFSIRVGGVEAMAIYANNDIYLNGTIYGAPTAVDGGDF